MEFKGYARSVAMRSAVLVEIETEWNLKVPESGKRARGAPGRDRNRVEFKACNGDYRTRIAIVEIETEWNLKLTFRFVTFALIRRDRNRVEFKGK